MADQLAQTVDIETPELVVVSYTIAGVGSRLSAGLIDLLICVGLFIGTLVGVAAITPDGGDSIDPMSTSVAIAITVVFQFVVLWGYYLLFEGLRDGQTPGKRLLGLRTVRDGGYSVGFSASAVRNLMRLVDLQPAFTYGVGITSIVASKSGKRLGDIVAGTLVVREALVKAPAAASTSRRSAPALAAPVGAAPVGAAPALLDDRELELLSRWADRRSSLDAERRQELTSQVFDRVRRALPAGSTASHAAQLLDLLDAERRARQAGAAARGTTGASRERYAIVATRSPRWIAFAARLTEARRGGLKSLGESGVRSFVAEYRALSADLARLRTATRDVSSDELFYLGRLVAAAHNLLYRDEQRTLRDALRFVAIEVPREVRRSFRPIALAAAFLFVPAAIAYVAVVRDPAVAPTFIPVHMRDRAESGVKRAANGEGYIDDPQVFRPVMASRIIANNVQVTIAVFAFGITAGIGTLALLLMNGVSLGGVFGLYQSKGILALLAAFVAPHGVLELSAICIGGAAGLLVASAMIIPGRRTRRRAFAENGARAMRLMAAAALMLVVAGSIEGMVSPIPYWPLSLKLVVSAATLVAMVLYFRGGLQQPARLDLEIPVDDGGRHLPGREVQHDDAGVAHARERLLALPD